MKKYVLLFIAIFFIVQTAFAHSVLSKNEEEYVINKDIPFFINIIPNNDDLKYVFDEEQVAYTPQVHFFNKKPEENELSNEASAFFISAKRSKSVSLQKNKSDIIELSSNYNFSKWSIKSAVSQESVSGINRYQNFVSFEPRYKINDNLSLFGGLSHSITENYEQTKLGIAFTPFKFKRLEFELSVSNYTKYFGSYRQTLNFNTNFKI